MHQVSDSDEAWRISCACCVRCLLRHRCTNANAGRYCQQHAAITVHDTVTCGCPVGAQLTLLQHQFLTDVTEDGAPGACLVVCQLHTCLQKRLTNKRTKCNTYKTARGRSWYETKTCTETGNVTCAKPQLNVLTPTCMLFMLCSL